MKFVSLFAGIGGFDLAFEEAGMECVAQVEIDERCNQVLAYHFPAADRRIKDVKEFTKDNFRGAIDLICGGFPCQDLSVAGQRAGLAGERSGLWFEFRRILEEFRPGWVVVENVPGLLSSFSGPHPPSDLEKGEEWEATEESDFGIVLRGLVELGYGVTWRVLDAQFFGIPQRRRRVFIVGSLGNGRSAQVLFEREGGAWDPPPSREAGARTTTGTGSSFKKRGGFGWPEHQGATGTLESESGTHQGGPERVSVVANCFNGYTGGADGNDAQGKHLVSTFQNTGQGWWNESETGGTIRERDWRDGHSNLIAGQCHGNNVGEMGTLRVGNGGLTGGVPFVADRIDRWVDEDDRIGAIQGDGHSSTAQEHVYFKPSAAVNSLEHVRPPKLINSGVRRLTPRECERLQAFPDDHTSINGMSDSARYRMLGNAVNKAVALWIGKRIMEVENG